MKLTDEERKRLIMLLRMCLEAEYEAGAAAGREDFVTARRVWSEVAPAEAELLKLFGISSAEYAKCWTDEP